MENPSIGYPPLGPGSSLKKYNEGLDFRFDDGYFSADLFSDLAFLLFLYLLVLGLFLADYSPFQNYRRVPRQKPLCQHLYHIKSVITLCIIFSKIGRLLSNRLETI